MLRPLPPARTEPVGATTSMEQWAPSSLVTHDTSSGLDAEGAYGLSLTTEEIGQFKARGYIIKRGLIPAETLAPFIEHIWNSLPQPLSRYDPDSWLDAGEKWDSGGEQGSGWGGATTPEGLPTTRMLDDFRRDGIRKMGGLGKSPDFVAATSAHPNVLHVVEALIGGPVKRPHSNRGVYCIFPRTTPAKLGPHHDNLPLDLGGVVLLGKVGRLEGGYTVWPGSHKLLYRGLDDEVNFVPNDQYGPALAAARDTLTPTEFAGDIGDVLFSHPLLVHSGGVNAGRNVRMAVIQDFQKIRPRGQLIWQVEGAETPHASPTKVDVIRPDGTVPFPRDVDIASAGGRRVKLRWHHDALEYGPARPTLSTVVGCDGMWREWNLGKHPPMGNIVDEAPWWEKYGLPFQVPIMRLDQIATLSDGVWTVTV